MGMFDTVGKNGPALDRNDNTLKKLKRIKTALSHQEPDRVPISDFFWGGLSNAGERSWDCPRMRIRTIITIWIGS